MKKLIIILLSILFFATALKATDFIDVIYLKDSTVIQGYIIEQEPGKDMQVKTLNGEYITINMAQVIKTEKRDKDDISLYKSDYFEFGGSFGTPAVLNLNITRWFSPFGIGISGLTLGSIYGIQGNLKFKLSDNYSRSHSIAFIFGTSHIELPETTNTYYGSTTTTEIKNWRYYGLAYNLNWGGFWLEVGLTGGSGDFKSPQLCFQIGYVYRFLK